MNKFAIVVIGYNRPRSILRLLKSLINVNYYGDSIPLIISIDRSGSDEVEKCCENFYWPHGTKEIIVYKERLGLRRHTLICGNITNRYDTIAVFEDDLYASPNFYKFAMDAVTYYQDTDDIAGISLYNHQWNVGSNNLFTPELNSYDTYFLQYAQSWGQIWTKKWWEPFYNWYEYNYVNSIESVEIPLNVSKWPDTSWLKYHIKYCVAHNKYFVYPKKSLSTNFGDAGQHSIQNNSSFQVPILWGEVHKFNFQPFNESSITYDAFFEREDLWRFTGVNKNELCTDLYGMKIKRSNKQYLLSMEKFDYKIICSYGLDLRPHEMNIILNIEGNDILLYDTFQTINNSSINDKSNRLKRTLFDIKSVTRTDLINVLIYNIINSIKRKLNKLKSVVYKKK